MQKLLKIFTSLRRVFEPFTWKWFQPKGWKNLEDLEQWDNVKDLAPSEFSKIVNSSKFPYKYDKVKGLLDNVQPIDEPQFFFKNLTSDRDCDNWARQWVIYYKYHNLPCQEWIVTNKKHPFTKSHLVAVANEGDGWRLLNYDRYNKSYETVEEALDDLSSTDIYAHDCRLQCLYRSYD